MQYMLLIYSAPGTGPAEGSPEFMEQMKGWYSYTEALREAGVMVSGEPLEPVPTATTVRVRNGETVLTDGPFAETKEHLGGFYIIDVPDLDAATQWASKMPNIGYGTVEVRPVMTLPAELPA